MKTGCIIAIIIFNLVLGGFLSQYVIEFWGTAVSHKVVDVQFWKCAVVGLFLGEVMLPTAIVTWIISWFYNPRQSNSSPAKVVSAPTQADLIINNDSLSLKIK